MSDRCTELVEVALEDTDEIYPNKSSFCFKSMISVRYLGSDRRIRNRFR